ncbi:MAG: hypothetical protein A3F18_01055 [Legionellales bacterium RIFCSPHIGHO2_12_FULL_37_14]|nr:MAG: hypothetical protein A3F18_01055 [Legionellales bacterium RIFCSPHIGHO2_12_FULL_37_14]
MAKKTQAKKYDLFADWGVRTYFSRIFSSEYDIVHEIQLAGYLSELEELHKEISRENKLEPVAANHEYNDLTHNFNIFTANLANQTQKAWKDVEEDALNYFNCGLSIFEDLGASNKNQEGYFLNTKTGLLRYKNKDGNYRDVCHFNGEELKRVKEIFPELSKEKLFVIKGHESPNSAELSPIRFARLIELAQCRKENENVEFHIPAKKSFVRRFLNLGWYMKLKGKQAEREYPGKVEDLVTKITEDIKRKIGEYRLADEDPAGKKMSQKEKNILQAIEQYLEDGDSAKLAKAAVENDTGWFKSLFRVFHLRGHVFSLLDQVNRLKESPFFEQTIKQIKLNKERAEAALKEQQAAEQREQLARQNANKPYEYIDILQDKYSWIANHQNKVTAYWSTRRVKQDAFVDSLQKVRTALLEIQSGITVDLPAVSLPHELEVEGEEAGKKTVIEHILDMLDRSIEKARESKNPRAFYQSECATLQNDIDTILREQRHEDREKLLLTEDVTVVYSNIGREVTKCLQATQNAKEAVKTIVSVADVRKEIIRLQKFHYKLIEQLAVFRDELRNIWQSTFHNDLEIFEQTVIKQRQERLGELLNCLAEIPDDNFDLLNPDNKFKPVINVINELESFGSKLTESLTTTLLYGDAERARTDKQREFITSGRSSDTDDKAAFRSIMHNINRFCDSISQHDEGKAKIKKTEVAEVSPVSMFPAGRGQASQVSSKGNRPSSQA